MSENVFVICGKEPGYLKLLSDFFSQRVREDFEFCIFTRIPPLQRHLQEGVTDILLMTEEFYEEMRETEAFRLSHPGLTFVLTEQERDLPDAVSIRYCQRGDRILYEIMEAYDRQYRKNAGTGTLIMVTASVGRCGRTSCTLKLAELLAGQGSTLALTLEDFCGTERFLGDGSGCSVSDLLYEAATGETLSGKEIPPPADGLSVLEAARYPEDIRTAEPEHVVRMLEQLRDCGRYRYVAVDLGDGVQDPHVVLQCADHILELVPDPEQLCGDPVQADVLRKKQLAWDSWMERRYRDLAHHLIRLRPEEMEEAAAVCRGLKQRS